MAYQSIISQLNWIQNGEQASSVVLNRPLLEFLAKYETGVFDLSTANTSIFADPSIFDAAVTDGCIVSLNTTTGVLEPSSISNYSNVIGIADVTNSRVYIKGVVDRSLLATKTPSVATDSIPTKYYVDYTVGSEGKVTTTINGNSPSIGVTLDYDGAVGGEKILIDINKTPSSDSFSTASGQTVFNTIYDPSNVTVYVEGIQLLPNEYTATDGQTITIPSVVELETVQVVSA